MHMDDDDIILEQVPDIDMFNLDDDLLDQLSPGAKEVCAYKIANFHLSIISIISWAMANSQSAITKLALYNQDHLQICFTQYKICNPNMQMSSTFHDDAFSNAKFG